MSIRSTVGYVVSDKVANGGKPRNKGDHYSYIDTFRETEREALRAFAEIGHVFDEAKHTVRLARLSVSFT